MFYIIILSFVGVDKARVVYLTGRVQARQEHSRSSSVGQRLPGGCMAAPIPVLTNPKELTQWAPSLQKHSNM